MIDRNCWHGRRKLDLKGAILASLLLVSPLMAQSTPDVAKATKGLNEWRGSREAMLMDDFGELARYREANAKLAAPAKGERRVVFFGDSITDGWKLEESFPGKQYINRGIGGQTTPQMLIRFREDVIDLKPAVIVILAGTNDIAGNTGPMSLEEIESNYASMADLARVHGVKVVFSSVLPVHNYTERAADFFPLRSPEKILKLNRWLQDYCKGKGCLYLDYFTALVDDKGLMKKEMADDGLHPNPAGYVVMAPLAEKAIGKALGKK